MNYFEPKSSSKKKKNKSILKTKIEYKIEIK